MSILPWPSSKAEIQELLKGIDNRLLNCTEDFIRLQVKKPVSELLSTKGTCKLNSPQSDWFNIYSIFNANQQLNESCNKLWAAIEIMYATDYKIWKKTYQPIGTKFNGAFILGTSIPALYYSQLSAIVSVLSIYGCVPIMLNKNRYYLLRTVDGWQLFKRGDYAQNQLGISTKSWHEIILHTFKSMKKKGLKLPDINIEKTFTLKKMRNEMHYEILGDLRMWRVYTKRTSFFKTVPLVIETISKSIQTIACIKKITTNCDERFEDLKNNFESF